MLEKILTTLGLVLIGGVGGTIAHWLQTPLPFMLGSLVSTALIATLFGRVIPEGYVFPQKFRLVFLAVIGVMIGAQVSPDLIEMLPAMLVSFSAIVLFVGLAHSGNYLIFRHIGGYDRPTAFYSATPGGLLESITMGEAAGADIATLTMQQFLRIILVITLVPIGLSFWMGAPVGSAGGMTLTHANPSDFSHLHEVVLTALVGLLLGKPLRLPARHLTGPLFAAALVAASGLAVLDLPNWMISVCQVVIGASLGMRLGGLRGHAVLRGAGLGLLSVGLMLGVGLAFSLTLEHVTGQPLDVLMVSFAPGGVTEMALIALSLNANPALVTAHHIWRIIVTVIELALFGRYVQRRTL
ncbi:AbrB family transcriptional regulator [Lutimaribacter sp. EGI FJ00015]|uniref:AbrB family transcriptional regulator n=1 Tax=Lutimaribacter degradans TaxID=2945989 RepID=A0ACC5ZY08_9RHOB|nr:AbrB family transcriptional regulator [Lutimaribacter sp. EGI FJ00013]MCM2562434.1 AbrB family transcriptional regulator [Lutimaribacter sp. EGI FJ00013]MCO0613591.1 AbrB family transcriptional regulator [Lutimaribacter sp. EGI FJ00015]MCO0636563.1 AbrB family transcriptional regulator [Lutimaribacter sp. EGI FJ00014]